MRLVVLSRLNTTNIKPSQAPLPVTEIRVPVSVLFANACLAAPNEHRGLGEAWEIQWPNMPSPLQFYYLHDLLPNNTANFLRRTAKYKSTVLDGPWNPASPDVLDVSPLYEETFIRLLGHPTAEEIAHTHSTFVLAISLRTNLPFPA
jgi:hypothetical protein